jgi:sarcosine oxidase, subunit beta
LLVGFQELVSRTFDPYGIGSEMDSAELYDEERDTDLLIEHAAALRSMAPTLDEWRFPHHVAGLSMYTPDGKFVIGRVEGVQGLLVAGGCCGLGVAASGGIGHAIAALASGDEPAVDLTAFRPDRFGAVDAGEPDFRARCSAARSVKSRG